MDTIGRFDGRVADYDRYRERYDAALLLPVLRERMGLLPTWKVVDVGAGTGMLADVFLENGNAVVAVEPNAEMRAACEELHRASGLAVVEGTAERTGLTSASADLIVVGRALHWFDLSLAVEEFRRVLRPDGWVAIISLGRSESGREENIELELLLRRYTADGGETHASYGVYRRLREVMPRNYYHRQMLSTMSLEWEQLHGLVLSLSWSPRRDDARYQEFARELRELFDHFARGGVFRIETRYWINLGQLEPVRAENAALSTR